MKKEETLGAITNSINKNDKTSEHFRAFILYKIQAQFFFNVFHWRSSIRLCACEAGIGYIPRDRIFPSRVDFCRASSSWGQSVPINLRYFSFQCLYFIQFSRQIFNQKSLFKKIFISRRFLTQVYQGRKFFDPKKLNKKTDRVVLNIYIFNVL